MKHTNTKTPSILSPTIKGSKSQKTSNVTAMERRSERSLAEKHKSIIAVIAYCIENDEKGMKALLRRNGVNVDSLRTKRGLTKTFLNALGKSKRLALEFEKYVEAKKIQPNTFNANGYDFSPRPLEFGLNYSYQNTGLGSSNEPFGSGSLIYSAPKTPSLASTTTDQTGSGFFSGINLKDLINTGVNIMEIQKDLQVSQDNKTAVEQAVQIKRDEINLKPSKSKTSMGTYAIVAVIGLGLLGGIIWFVKKKK